MTSPQHFDTPSRPDHCVAVKSQLQYYSWEEGLFKLARAVHPRVAWWWAPRTVVPRVIATCYICDLEMASWPRVYPMPRRAKTAVERHKFVHRSAATVASGIIK